MMRSKRANLFTKPLNGLLIARADGKNESWSDKSEAGRGEFPTEFNYTKFQIRNVARSWWTNFSPKWYLAAFPVNEVNKDYGLTQNPGW